MKRVSIQLKETSEPIEHMADNSYQKGNLYCVYVKADEMVYKYPMADIWRIAEGYGTHKKKTT